MQLRLEPPPDLRPPDDPEAARRHGEVIARFAPAPDADAPPPDPAPDRRREAQRMRREGWRCWLPDGTRLAARLGADAPDLLFVAGTPDVATPAVAVVGTRRPDAYGLAMARAIGSSLAAAGAVVVSGGALGVDAAAHEGALQAGGATVAVLGGGLGRPHPPSHRALFARIAASAGGCVVSEAPCLAPARAFCFPRRNRLLAAWADAVVVVQAGVPSGALITAQRAAGMGVPVFAVPGDAWYERSEGTLALLREGARPFGAPADLADLPGLRDLAAAPWPRPGSRPFGLPSPWAPAPPPPPPAAGEDVDRVLAAVSAGARTVDALADAASLPAGRVLAALLSLELAGTLRVLPGGAVVPL